MGIWNKLLPRPRVPVISAGEVAARLSRGEECAIVDVREADEWEAGHIPGARWVPLGELSQRHDELPKDREIIAVCRSGNRSAAAARFLAEHGYEVKNLEGGMLAWPGAVKQGKR